MGLESLVSAVWRLEGFLTAVRHPVRVKGGYSDIDVVGIRERTLRVAECKARGPALRVNVERNRGGWSRRWDASLANLALLLEGEQRPKWLQPSGRIVSLEYHLIGNVWFANPDDRIRAEARLRAAVQKCVPRSIRGRCGVRVCSSAELIIDAIKHLRRLVVEDDWGKRTGDPVLDVLRELVRYANPEPVGGRNVAERISEDTRDRLLSSLFQGIDGGGIGGRRRRRRRTRPADRASSRSTSG